MAPGTLYLDQIDLRTAFFLQGVDESQKSGIIINAVQLS